jgi:hypothetical protein
MCDEIQKQTGVSLIREHDRGNARIRLINDTWIYLRPFNRISKIRGMTLAFAGVDEADHSEADPDLNSLRDHSRFKKMLASAKQRLGLAAAAG